MIPQVLGSEAGACFGGDTLAEVLPISFGRQTPRRQSKVGFIIR